MMNKLASAACVLASLVVGGVLASPIKSMLGSDGIEINSD